MPLPVSLVVKNGSNEMRHDIIAHAAARIPNHQRGPGSGGYPGSFTIGLGSQHQIARFDAQLASFRHGVAGVHDQVHDNLFDKSRIGSDMPQQRFQACFQFDIVSNQALQHLDQSGYDSVQVEHLGFWSLIPAEQQQLTRQ